MEEKIFQEVIVDDEIWLMTYIIMLVSHTEWIKDFICVYTDAEGTEQTRLECCEWVCFRIN